jgi:hypothetical protein
VFVGTPEAVNKLENIANISNIFQPRKQKLWHFSKKKICKITTDNKTTEQVSSLNYLGINTSDCLTEDINIKISKFQRICGTIRRILRLKNLTRTQLKVYKVVEVRILTYASENWTINRSDKRIIKSAEMRFLRPVAEYTLLDQKRTTDIRSELKIFNSTERIR